MRELAPRGGSADTRLKIGIVGFGKFGQFIAKGFVKKHDVFAMSRGDYSMAARDIGKRVGCRSHPEQWFLLIIYLFIHFWCICLYVFSRLSVVRLLCWSWCVCTLGV